MLFFFTIHSLVFELRFGRSRSPHSALTVPRERRVVLLRSGLGRLRTLLKRAAQGAHRIGQAASGHLEVKASLSNKSRFLSADPSRLIAAA
jgi:hypothetical protein